MEGLWSGDNYIQVIERLQFLAAEPPELRVQFLNDMMINRTIDREPINVLIPIPDNYIQKQGVFEVISEQKEKKEEEEEDLNKDLCPENVDLLNISNAYSIPVPSFNNLEIENEEMYIARIPKPEEKIDYSIETSSLYCKGNEVEPFVIENYAWDINRSERTWTGDMRAVRINKLDIESNKQDWNNLVEQELASQFDLDASFKKEKKKKKKVTKVEEKSKEKNEEEQENKEEQENEEIEEIEEIEDFNQEEEEEGQRRLNEKEKRKKRKDQKYFKTKKFSLTFKENKKRFKKIYVGDNEIITLKAIRRVLKPGKTELKQSDTTDFKLGGNGFDANKYKWAPVPFNAQTMSIEKTKIEIPLENVSTDKMEVPAARRRTQDWNLVNNLSSESTVNILTKEKLYLEQKMMPITVLGEPNANKNKWNDKIRKQKGFKLGFPSTKKWTLNICKEIDIDYEQEADDVIINDDYNNVKGPEMRPITATIIKVNEEDDTSSVSSYDVFQNFISKKIEYDYNVDIDHEIQLMKNRNSYRNPDKDDKKNKFKLRVPNENEQKNKYDKTVKNLANQANNLIGKRKKIELIREDPEPKNYLRV